MAAIVLATIRDRVRRLCGGPDTTEFTNADIEGFITGDTLDWYNRRRPGKAISSLTTVALQQIYDSKPSNAYYVTDVWWHSGDYIPLTPNTRYLPESFDFNEQLGGYNVVNDPAMVEEVFRKIESYKNTFNGSGWEAEDGKIWLQPRPDTAGTTVYFMYTYPLYSAITGIDDKWSDCICNMAASHCLNYLAIKRGMIRSGKNFTGGGGANELTIAEKYRVKAESLLPIFVNPFSRG